MEIILTEIVENFEEICRKEPGKFCVFIFNYPITLKKSNRVMGRCGPVDASAARCHREIARNPVMQNLNITML